jgi:hypothetical protein
VTGPKAVPEFVTAFAAGQKEYKNDETARQWLTTNLTPDLRDGFYRDRQRALQALLKQAPAVQSVMTDRNGTAYFTDLAPGTYTLSNIVATELGANATIWNCEVPVRQDERAFERPFLIMNRNEKKDKNVKCVAVEKPLPVCESAAK